MQTKEQHIEALNRFYKENNRYPMSRDFDLNDYLPSRKTLERRYGGIVNLKKELGIVDSDGTRGEYRKKIVKEINERNNKIEARVYKMLVEKFGLVNVHRAWSPYDDTKCNIDFVVFLDGNKAIGFELFYPKDSWSFASCLRIKAHKEQYLERINEEYETQFYYIVTNEEMNQKEVNENLKSIIKNPVKANGVLSMDSFKKLICDIMKL